MDPGDNDAALSERIHVVVLHDPISKLAAARKADASPRRPESSERSKLPYATE
jgi:hypothetical protein